MVFYTALPSLMTEAAKLSNLPNLMTLPEGNGTPLQYSCVENPMDGGSW